MNPVCVSKVKKDFEVEEEWEQGKLLFGDVGDITCFQSYFREEGQDEGHFPLVSRSEQADSGYHRLLETKRMDDNFYSLPTQQSG